MPETRSDITLLVTDFAFQPGDIERLRAALGPDRVLTTRDAAGLAEALANHPEADVICTLAPPARLPEVAPHLRWLALASAGADRVIEQDWLRAPNAPLVTTANGVHATNISEHVFSAMLLWARHWPELLRLQQEHRWPVDAEKAPLAGRELAGATLLIVGLGAIGRGIARLGRAFGMRVLATRRSVPVGGSDPDVDALIPQDKLGEALAEADYIALAIPSTPETFHLIDAEQLSKVKRGAFLVNIARGDVVDEAALIAALRNGLLGGASLDVMEHEPLPPESPLWTAPNVTLSPHISGWTMRYSERLTDLLLDNIARYRDGRSLRNLVDVARGY